MKMAVLRGSERASVMLRGGDLYNVSVETTRVGFLCNIHVVSDTRGSKKLSGALLGLPDTEKLDKQVVREAAVEHLADEEDVGGQSRLQHDGHVGGVEQTDRVRATDTTLAGRLDWNLNAESLQIDDSAENENSGDQVHDVGEVLTVEGLLECNSLVGPGEEQVNKRNQSTLKLRATTSVDGGGGEGLPHDRLANVGGNEERDTAAETIALLEELVKENDNQTSNHQLDDEQDADTGTKVGWLSIKTRDNVDDSLAKGQENGKELLSGLVEFAVRLEVKVDVNQVGSGKKLEDHARGDDGGDTQLHQRTSVTRHHHAQPVERVRGIRRHNSVEWHLAHDEEDEERETSPY